MSCAVHLFAFVCSDHHLSPAGTKETVAICKRTASATEQHETATKDRNPVVQAGRSLVPWPEVWAVCAVRIMMLGLSKPLVDVTDKARFHKTLGLYIVTYHASSVSRTRHLSSVLPLQTHSRRRHTSESAPPTHSSRTSTGPLAEEFHMGASTTANNELWNPSRFSTWVPAPCRIARPPPRSPQCTRRTAP